MRFTNYFGLAAAGLVLAEDLLMHEKLQEVEYKQAIALGYTVKLVNDKEWKALTTADFTKYKAIVIADPDCVYDDSPIDFFTETKDVWSPAISGNIVVIGTDPSYHSYGGELGADTLIENSIKFVADGESTGLYFALSCYYHRSEFATIDALSNFGKFVVRGQLNCYNNAHIVAKHPAMDSLSDAALSGWECSVHEAFSEYPVTGVNGFEALAIAKNILGVGSRSFGDGTNGLPYIISRGATPAGCGNGKYEAFFNEECDHGEDVNGVGDDLCSTSCKCLYGVLDASEGSCKPKPPPVVGTSTGVIPSYSSTVIPPYPTSSPEPPKDDCTVIVGIEVIVTVIVSCPAGSTETTTLTSTLQRPIYSTTVEGFPCYPCALGTPDAGSFITVSYTSCASEATPTLTYKMCQTCTEKTVSTEIPGYTSGECHSCTDYVSERPKTHVSTATTSSAVATTSSVKSYGTIMPTTSGKSPIKPSTTAAFVTAGAPRNLVGGVGAGVLGGLIALAAL